MSDQICFDRSGFARLLKAVGEAGYEFSRLDAPVTGGHARFYLRHDVDISPRLALLLGEIEREHGAVASFFFQMNAETYSLFSKTTLGVMNSLRDMWGIAWACISIRNCRVKKKTPLLRPWIGSTARSRRLTAS
jgi:hypothetical protein